jgi:hypothetical protein
MKGDVIAKNSIGSSSIPPPLASASPEWPPIPECSATGATYTSLG